MKWMLILGCIGLWGCGYGQSSVAVKKVDGDSSPVTSQADNGADSLIFTRIVDKCKKEQWQKSPLPYIEIKVSQYFLGTPYVASTLEKGGEEQLVVNLREMDCTTFVENVTAISLCIKENKWEFGDLKARLTQIRYRNGIIDRYPSRLHYFVDWLVDNQQKGLINLVSEQIGDSVFDASVGFMSAHSDKYPALIENPDFIPQIREAEKRISSYKLKYIPKAQLAGTEHRIQNGDVLALSTTVNGLDIAHVGIAFHQQGRLHMIHASTTEKKVVITAVPLNDYMAGIKKQSGLLVGRLKE
jgi:hypothetical protein